MGLEERSVRERERASTHIYHHMPYQDSIHIEQEDQSIHFQWQY